MLRLDARCFGSARLGVVIAVATVATAMLSAACGEDVGLGMFFASEAAGGGTSPAGSGGEGAATGGSTGSGGTGGSAGSGGTGATGGSAGSGGTGGSAGSGGTGGSAGSGGTGGSAGSGGTGGSAGSGGIGGSAGSGGTGGLSGAVGYWPFDGNANDMSGNGHHGTSFGATLTTDRFDSPDSAYYFDGNDHIEVPDHPDLGGFAAVTVCAWVYPQCPDSGNGCAIAGKQIQGDGNSSTDSYSFGMNRATKRPQFAVFTSDGEDGAEANDPLASTVWQHVCGVYDGQNIYVYVDGTPRASKPLTGTVNPSVGSPLWFGDCAGCTTSSMVGRIDDIKIWDFALSPAEVFAEYQATSAGM